MKYQIGLFLLCAPVATACMQTLDSSITGDGKGPPVAPGNSSAGDGSTAAEDSSTPLPKDGGVQPIDGTAPAPADDAGSSPGPSGSGTTVCNGANIIDPSSSPTICNDNTPNGTVIVTQTPPIELPDGGGTDNACDLTIVQSLAIRQTYCGGCHGQMGMPTAPFHNILDDTLPDGGGLLNTTSIVTRDPMTMAYVPLIVPGDPEHSYLYQRVAARSMPPRPSSLAVAPYPMPNLSDIGVLHDWIANCLPVPPPPGDGGAPDASTGGTPDAGAMDAGAPRDAGRGG